MKRPGGFDRPAEPPRRSGSPIRPERWLERARGRDVSEQGDEPAAGPAQQPETELSDGSGAESAVGAIEIAPTVDLSEVRERRSRGQLLRASAAGLGERGTDPVRAAAQRVRDAARHRRAHERRERRRFSAPWRRRRRSWLIAGGAVLALALFVGVGVLTPIMAVERIRISGAGTVDADAVTEALKRFEGVPLALVNEGEVHRALEPFPLIQRYAIERIPPHTLLVRIEERVPVIALERDGHFDLYDPAGVLVGRADERPEGVPQGEGSVRNVASDAFRSAAEVLRDIPADLRDRVASVSASSAQDVAFELTDGVEVIWGEASQTQRKSVVLSSMIKALKKREVQVIDVSSTQAPVFR